MSKHRMPKKSILSRFINVEPGPVSVNVLNGARVTFLVINVVKH